jgi:tRNA(Ile)-lysidine synthase
MLHLCHRFSPSHDWRVRVLHINHGLRPEAAAEQSFVEALSIELGLPFEAVEGQPDGGGSMESRWSSLRQSVYSRQPDLVAVAHNAGDRAETILLRLVQGAGLRGLGGMDYRGRGPVRRPMLDIDRQDIRRWLEGEGIHWMEDRSNLDTDIARNRMRREVLPRLTESFPEAVGGICRSGAVLSAWRDLQEQISCMFPAEETGREDLISLPDALAALALWNMAGRPRKGFDELRKVIRWLRSGGKGEHILPGGKRLVATEDMIRIEKRGTGRF